MAKRQVDSGAKADEPTIAPDSSGTEPQTSALPGAVLERVGGTIGPYKLLDELGEGGMGTVFLAEQDHPVRRRVALKIIKAGLDTAQVIARFEAERQALALMDHPNIARVVDAGTTSSGRPFFVMELVQGVPITGYCDQRRLPLRERLALFLPVCRAVQHAHQKGIIHRDLKPSNILVTIRDDQPVPKIIDFGIAKATTHRLTERTLYTQYGQLVGTPDYMSPEQAGLGGLDVDTRSDVYSLGAVLYELLCGDTPLGRERIKTLDFVSMLTVIYEQEPPPPSRRMTELGDKGADIARRRDSEPAKLAQQMRGELDWIATKALEKERTRRYESPSALAADIERHLNNEPVEASPHSATYRLKKFARRNRAPLAAAAAIAAVLVGGIIASGLLAYRATQAEQEMAEERAKALQAKAQAERLLVDVEAARKSAEAQRQVAENAKKLAESQRKLADDRGAQLAVAAAQSKDAAEKERTARSEVEKRLREADAMRLAMESNEVRQRYPQRALLLAAEAVDATRRKKEPILPAADQALRDSLSVIGGSPLIEPYSSTGILQSTAQGRWLFGNDATSVRRWDLAANDPASSNSVIGPPELQHTARATSPDGRWLATVSAASGFTLATVHLWDLRADALDRSKHQLRIPVPVFGEVIFSPDGHWLITKSNKNAMLWDMTAKDPAKSPILLTASDTEVLKLATSPKGRWAVSADQSGAPSLWELTQTAKPRALDSEGAQYLQTSADGRWAAAAWGPNEAQLRVWDLNADDPLQSRRDVPYVQKDSVAELFFRFTPDGRYLAAAWRGEITLWDLTADAWKEPHLTLLLPEPESGPRYSKLIHELTGDDKGEMLLAIRHDGTIYRWDLKAKEPQASRTILGRHPGASNLALKVSPSGRWLVTTRENTHARLWDLWNRNLESNGMPLHGHDSGVTQFAMGGAAGLELRPSPHANGLPQPAVSERWLVTGDRNGKPRLWDLSAADPARAGIQTGDLTVAGRNMAVGADGVWVVFDSPDKVKRVDLNAKNPVSTAIDARLTKLGATWSNQDFALSSDGRWFARREADSIALWNLANGDFRASQSDAAASELLTRIGGLFPPDAAAHKPDKIVRGAGLQVERFAISPDGRWLLATTAKSIEPMLWNLEGAGAEATAVNLGGGIGNRQPAQFSPDGRWLAAVGQSGGGFSFLGPARPVVVLWDLASNKPRKLPLMNFRQAPVGLVTLGFSADGKWLAAGSHNVAIARLGPEGPVGDTAVLGYNLPTPFQQIALSRDGQRIAAAAGGSVYVWRRDADTAAQPQVLLGHEQAIQAMEFSPDDRWLATAGEDGDVRLWDIAAEQPQAAMIVLQPGGNPSSGEVQLRFSPDSKWLGSRLPLTQRIRLWQLDASGHVENARRLAARELNDDELRQYRLDVPEVLRARLAGRAAAIGRQLEKNPNDRVQRQLHVNLLACAGEFPEAIDAMRLLIRLDPKDHFPQYQLLPLLAEAGQTEAYVQACNAMAENFAETGQPEVFERVAKGSLFWAESSAGWKKAAQFAERGLKEATARNHQLLPWFQATKGLAEYRQGNYAAALEWADTSLSSRTRLAMYFVVPAGQLKAMAHAQLGQLEAAEAALAKAKEDHASVPSPLDLWSDWHDWYMADIMFREAEALLREKSLQATSGVEPGATP